MILLLYFGHLKPKAAFTRVKAQDNIRFSHEPKGKPTFFYTNVALGLLRIGCVLIFFIRQSAKAQIIVLSTTPPHPAFQQKINKHVNIVQNDKMLISL